MKKITCFTSNLSGGGDEHQLVLLSNFLAEKGYDVTIVTYNNIPDHYILDNRIKRVKLDVDGKPNLLKQWVISRYFGKLKTDCIISFRADPNFILLIPMLFTREPKIIVSERNTTITPSRRESINYNYLYNRANYIVPNSYTQENFLRKLGKKWADRVITITNYTDVNEYTPKGIPDNDDCILIGIFSRIFPQKNYERFCEMLSLLKQQTIRKFKVIWYGDKKEGEFLKGSLHIHKLIEQYDIGDVIEVREAVNNVSGLMGQFHAMCLPSLYEGFSNAISEYICSGKVVLCSDVSDNHIMVHNGENGLLFDPKDISSMCSAFLNFFELSDEQIKEMGHRSRLIAETLFNRDRFVNSYIDLIEK